MQFLFVPPLLFGNRRCRLPSQAQGLGRVTVHEHWHFFQPLLLAKFLTWSLRCAHAPAHHDIELNSLFAATSRSLRSAFPV